MELGDKLLALSGLEMSAIRVNLASFERRSVRFLDPNIERISRVPVSSGEQDVVPIRPISAWFYGKEGTLLQRT